jgi:hypothetical protein
MSPNVFSDCNRLAGTNEVNETAPDYIIQLSKPVLFSLISDVSDEGGFSTASGEIFN